VLKCLLSTKLLLVFNQISLLYNKHRYMYFHHWYHLLFTSYCTWTISRHLVVPLTHSSCQFTCKKLFLKNSRQPDPPLPPGKVDHQFFIFMWPYAVSHSQWSGGHFCFSLHPSGDSLYQRVRNQIQTDPVQYKHIPSFLLQFACGILYQSTFANCRQTASQLNSVQLI